MDDRDRTRRDETRRDKEALTEKEQLAENGDGDVCLVSGAGIGGDCGCDCNGE